MSPEIDAIASPPAAAKTSAKVPNASAARRRSQLRAGLGPSLVEPSPGASSGALGPSLCDLGRTRLGPRARTPGPGHLGRVGFDRITMDLTAPRAGRRAPAFDELLEPIEVAGHAPVEEPRGLAHPLQDPVRLGVDAKRDPRLRW